MIGSDPISDEAEKHIQRHRVLRRLGIVNRFTDVRSGPEAMLTEEEAEETFAWIQANLQIRTRRATLNTAIIPT